MIRHGLPVRHEVEVGAADPELSEIGRRQAEHLATYLAAEGVDAICSSPLRRARETAAPLARATGIGCSVVDDVAEGDRGSSSYVPIEELRATNDPRWQAIVRDGLDLGDETPQDFSRRVVDAVEGIVARHPGVKVAVVCHGGVINAWLCHVLGLPPQHALLYPFYTGIHRFAASRSGHRTVVTVNETAHLRGTGLPIGLDRFA